MTKKVQWKIKKQNAIYNFDSWAPQQHRVLENSFFFCLDLLFTLQAGATYWTAFVSFVTIPSCSKYHCSASKYF